MAISTDTDDDAQHGKKSPELIGKHAFEGHLDAFLQHIIPSVHP